MRTSDFVVVGAGIAGASVAFELADHGSVVILERESSPGYHSTGRSAALLTENYGNDIIRRLTISSRDFFNHPPDQFAEHALLLPRGILWLARSDQMDALHEVQKAGQRYVASIHALDVDMALQMCPALRPSYVAGAVFEPEAMDIDVDAVHQGYLGGFKRRGGIMSCDAEVTAVERSGDSWVVRTKTEDYSTAVVVNAGGAWCDQIGELAGARPLGLTAKRRTVITFDPPEGNVIDAWPVVVDVGETFYFKPEAGRILASPADETPVPPSDVQPEEIDVATAVDRVQTATSFAITRITHKWAGLRTFSPDMTPVVGMDPDLAGFFWLAGQGGYGVMTAPAMAKAATGLITKGALPQDLQRQGLEAVQLSPARFQ